MNYCLVCRGRCLTTKMHSADGDVIDDPKRCVNCRGTRVISSDDEDALIDVIRQIEFDRQ